MNTHFSLHDATQVIVEEPYQLPQGSWVLRVTVVGRESSSSIAVFGESRESVSPSFGPVENTGGAE